MTDNLTRESWEITSREAWAERRGKDVPASLMPNMIEGADPYGDPAKLVAHVSGTAKREEPTPQMRGGIIGEAMFPDAVAMEHPEWPRLVKATTYHRLPEVRLGCTPDFWVGEDGLLQAKTCSERVWERWQGRPPLGYTLQTLCEVLVTGRSWGVLGVIVRSDLLPLYLYDVPRHPQAEAKILAAVAEFWRAFEAGEFPTPAPADEIAAMLDDGSHIDLSDDLWLAEEALPQRERLVEMISDATRQRDMINEQIQLRMGKASTAFVPGWSISWRKTHYKEYTVKAQDRRTLRVKRTKETNDELTR